MPRPKTGGRKKGTPNKTPSKEASRELVRTAILAHLNELLAAQISHARGLKYLVTRDKKTGKFVRVTEAMARLKQHDQEQLETIEVWEKDPSVQAFTDLMNRAIDKPKEQAHEVALSGKVTLEQLVAGIAVPE